MDYQKKDAEFLANCQYAGCFNHAGSGKTAIAIEAIRLAKAKKVLIICPPIALIMWQENIKTYLDLEAVIIDKNDPEKLEGADVIIVTYERATSLCHNLKDWANASPSVNALILDESHKLKTHKSERTKSILGKSPFGGKDSLCGSFKHTWFLTATPILSWPDDLIPFLFLANPTELSKHIGKLKPKQFKERYLRQIPVTTQYKNKYRYLIRTIGTKNEHELNIILKSCATQRTENETNLNLPKLIIRKHNIGSASSWSDIDARNNICSDFKIPEKSGQSLATRLRLVGLEYLEYASLFIYDKYREINSPILVGSWHTEVIDNLANLLLERGIPSIEILTGATPFKTRSNIEKRFNAGEINILIGQISAMGVSMNLQYGSHQIVIVERTWSPTILDQFYKRLHRIGQKNEVYIDILLQPDRTQDAVGNVLVKKADAITRVTAHQIQG